MKLEKRSGGEPEGQPMPQTQPAKERKKPVVVYIMILFIVAFLLMALSFFMHQRSNNEVIGELQNSVTALKELQSVQDENMQLQEQLEDANSEISSLQDQLSGGDNELAQAQQQLAAMESLYALQQQYAGGDYDACREMLQSMQDSGQDQLLPKDSISGVTAPADRYQQLKEAVLSK